MNFQPKHKNLVHPKQTVLTTSTTAIVIDLSHVQHLAPVYPTLLLVHTLFPPYLPVRLCKYLPVGHLLSYPPLTRGPSPRLLVRPVAGSLYLIGALLVNIFWTHKIACGTLFLHFDHQRLQTNFLASLPFFFVTLQCLHFCVAVFL